MDNAANIRSAVVCSHCAGSSRIASVGASPWARRGSLPSTRTRAPVFLSSMLARLAESCYAPAVTIFGYHVRKER